MNRQFFRGWGAELSDIEMAQALAAHGVLRARRGNRRARPEDVTEAAVADLLQGIASRRLPDPSTAWLPWRLTPWYTSDIHARRRMIPAGVLAKAWQQSGLMNQRIRLEVRWDRQESAEDIIEELSRPEVGLGSVYHRVDKPSTAVKWQWPLRVGLLDDARSRALRGDIVKARANIEWMNNLVTLDDAEDINCDLLILPMDLKNAVVAVMERSGIKADCTVVLGRNTGAAIHRANLLRTMRSAVHTSGVAVSHIPRDKQLDWFVSLIRELSHSSTIDLALYLAAGWVNAKLPYVAASRKLVEATDLAEQVQRMGNRFKRSAVRKMSMEIDPGSAAERNLGLTAGSHSFREIGEKLESVPRDRGFLSEEAMASVAAELGAASAGAEPAETEARWIQTQVIDEQYGKPVSDAFRPGAAHVINVHIGPNAEGWLAPPAADEFPSELLPKTGTTHTLKVLLSEPQLMDQPQMATIELPQTGKSTACSFHVFVPETVRTIAARIVIIHENRVLQTALLRGGVGEPQGPNKQLYVEVEAVVRSALSDLDQRSHFHATLVLNEDTIGTKRITSVSNDSFEQFAVSAQLDKEIKWFDDRLTQVAYDRALFDGLEKPDTVELLRDFASHGRNLYRHIVGDQLGTTSDLARGDRIQVVSLRADERLPVEFIYDRATPGPAAQLCPNAAAALRNGQCDAACPHDDADPCICPFGFWGLRKVIERHAHDPKVIKRFTSGAFAFAGEPLRHSQDLKVLTGGLVAGSQRVDASVADGLDRICAKVASVTSKPTVPVRTLKDWRDHVKDQAPTLEILIVHTEPVSSTDNMSRLEVGAGEWLRQADLDERYVTSAPGTVAPLILLLGCETAAPEVDFAGFIAACRWGGAAIIVAAGAKIHSEHAVRVAEAFVDALAIARASGQSGQPRTFGEVMRDVRRHMLADGQPMVLTLCAYGDADWRLA